MTNLKAENQLNWSTFGESAVVGHINERQIQKAENWK